VAQTGNGFVFEAYDHWDLFAQVVRALETFRQPALWRRLQSNAMSTDVSWTNSALQYVELYREAMVRHAELAGLLRRVRRAHQLVADGSNWPERLIELNNSTFFFTNR